MSTMITTDLSTSGFLQLPGEVRTIIYRLVFDGLKEDDEQWAINLLKISRSWYNEAMPVIVSNLHHNIVIRFNSIWNQTEFQIMKRKVPSGMIRYVKNLTLTISIEHESHPDLPAQINELETNLHRIVMTLVQAEIRLENLFIHIDEDEKNSREALGSSHVFQLLENLRELRVTKDVQITGLLNDHNDYLEVIKYSMLLPEASGLSYHPFKIIQDKKPILGMCLDMKTYVRTCRRIVEHWNDDDDDQDDEQKQHIIIDEKAARLRDLAEICPETEYLDQQLDSLEKLPESLGTNIRNKIIPEALGRIEKFNKSITNPLLRRYSKNAPFDQLTDAYDRIYMRKSLLEIKLGLGGGGHQQQQQQQQQLSLLVDEDDDNVADLHFMENARYENSPWHTLSYEDYHELPPIGYWEPIEEDE